MVIKRKKNALRNVSTGFLVRLFQLAAFFICRTIIVRYLGLEYLGLGELFNSVLMMLNMAELGFGSALVFNMYEPIAKNDRETLCALFKCYKVVYFWIGIVVLCIGCALIPALHYFIRGSYPEEISIEIVYFINLISVDVSYFFMSYKKSILMAYQRNDVLFQSDFVQYFIQLVLQSTVLIVFKNYYAYICIVPLAVILNNLYAAMKVDRMYPDLKPMGTLDSETKIRIRNNVGSLWTYKIGNVVSNAVDNVVISTFLGLAVLAKYSNYYCIITALFSFLVLYYNSISAGIGNCIALDDINTNYKLFNRLFFMQGWLIGWMSICLVCLFQDFIAIWVGEGMQLSNALVFLLGIYFYAWKIHDIVSVFKEAAGMWKYDKWRPIVSSVCNVALSVFFVRRIGLYGVVIPTILCDVIFSATWGVIPVFKHYFEKNVFEYYFKLLKYFIIMIFAMGCTYIVSNLICFSNIYGNFLLKILICMIVPNGIFFLFYRKSTVFKECREDVVSIIKRRA